MPIDDATRPTVMVSGCFDLLHSGHVAFLTEAAALGRVVVCAGADRTVMELKGRPPINNERERAYMLGALGCVDEARVSRGSGVMDFLPELEEIRPEVFFVNADGDSPQKREAVESRGVRYVVAERVPAKKLPPRSTTSLRTAAVVPYRLDLAGGWLDQPWVSELAAGPVVGISLEPDDRYERRSGMASSTRQSAMAIWGPRLPVEDREKLAKLLFSFENPPGTKNMAGSQDAIAVVYPGLTKMDYHGAYWPDRITSCLDPDVLEFIESHLYLRFMRTRPGQFEVLDETRVNADAAKRLGDAAERLWAAALSRDARRFGRAMTDSLEAQVDMFPLMRPDDVRAELNAFSEVSLGHKISGAGGGGYAVFFSEEPIPDAIRPKIRVED
ncbi:MAG: adenylyltransferase/cytidyltransferase family protein [Planctomycetota bacterium]